MLKFRNVDASSTQSGKSCLHAIRLAVLYNNGCIYQLLVLYLRVNRSILNDYTIYHSFIYTSIYRTDLY